MSPHFRQFLFSCGSAGQEHVCLCCQTVRQVRNPGPSSRPLLQNERPSPGSRPGPGQDRITPAPVLQEAVSPYRLLGAKHGPSTPGPPTDRPPRVPRPPPALPSVSQQCHSNQTINHAAQTSPGSPVTIALPFHHSTLNISPPKQSRPTPRPGPAVATQAGTSSPQWPLATHSPGSVCQSLAQSPHSLTRPTGSCSLLG